MTIPIQVPSEEELKTLTPEELSNMLNNAVYELVLAYSERLEARNRFVGSGHHYAQTTCQLISTTLKERVLPIK